MNHEESAVIWSGVADEEQTRFQVKVTFDNGFDELYNVFLRSRVT